MNAKFPEREATRGEKDQKEQGKLKFPSGRNSRFTQVVIGKILRNSKTA